MNKIVTAKLRHLRIAPRKTRAVAQIISGLPVNEAEAQLMLLPRRAALPLLKLLRSAVANAKNNHKLDVVKLYVKNIKVDQGPKFRRWLPRARGGVDPIDKKTSHVTIVLESSDKLPKPKFVIQEKKKEKKEKPAKKGTKKETREREIKKTVSETKPVAKDGFFKKMFRRKAV